MLKKIEFITLYPPNQYRILHIAPSSSKSSNVSCMFYNCMQCAFSQLGHYIFFYEMTCAFRVTKSKMIIFLISESKRVISFLNLKP